MDVAPSQVDGWDGMDHRVSPGRCELVRISNWLHRVGWGTWLGVSYLMLPIICPEGEIWFYICTAGIRDIVSCDQPSIVILSSQQYLPPHAQNQNYKMQKEIKGKISFKSFLSQLHNVQNVPRIHKLTGVSKRASQRPNVYQWGVKSITKTT